MSVVEKFAAFVGSLSPAETGEVMPLMINFMQGNLGAGMTGPSNAGPATAMPPPPPGGDTGPGAPPPPGMSPGPEPLPPPQMPGLQPGGLMGRPPMPPTQIGSKSY